MTTSAPCLEYQGVSFAYADKPILQNLSLSVHANERVALIGPNGCGKSTIVRLALGLEIADRGTTLLFGRRASWDAHVPQLGYIGDPRHSEDGWGLPLWLTTKQLVATYRQMLREKCIRDFEYELYHKLQISALSEKTVKTLSAGERRRLMTYMALAKAPSLLISDEATEVVYEEQRPVLLQCILDCCEKFGTAVLWISHDVDSTALIADTVYLMTSAGQVERLQEPNFAVTVFENGENSLLGIINQRKAIYEIRNRVKDSSSDHIRILLDRSVEQ